MQDFLFTLELCLVFLGTFFLLLSLYPIRELVRQLPIGKLKYNWSVLALLITFFLFGYLFFGINLWLYSEHRSSFDLIVPAVFFSGGVFVFLVGKLALQTAKDIQKIASLHYESITDALMQIKNRRYFEQSLNDEIKISHRYHFPLSLLLLDIDNFKSINDTYGHMLGDEVLRNLAKVIKTVARDSDILCRYGGEEIAIIAPNTNKEKAEIFAQRLISSVRKGTMALCCATQEEIKITVSIGVASVIFDENTSKETLLANADDALYTAKQTGKDKIVLS